LRVGPQQFAVYLRSALQDSDEDVRAEAVGSLYEYRDEADVPRLIRVLETDHSVKIKERAKNSLGQLSYMMRESVDKRTERNQERMTHVKQLCE
jgi:HEAT repeats